MNQKPKMSTDLSKIRNVKFHENPYIGEALFHEDSWTKENHETG